MLDDVVFANGRQRNRKFIFFGILLAAGVLIICVMAAFPLHLRLRLLGAGSVETAQWTLAECTPDSDAVSVGDQLYYMARQRALSFGGREEWVCSFQEDPRLGAGEPVMAYVPGERSVTLLSVGIRNVAVPGAVDGVIPGGDAFGVILSGSGYLTNTVLYDLSGEKLCEIGLVEEAMINGCFLGEKEGFAALSYGTDGVWQVGFYSFAGTLYSHQRLISDTVPQIMPLGGNVCLITDEDILILDHSGEVIASLPLGVWEPGLTASGRDCLAMVLFSRGAYRIMTVSSRGEILGQWELPNMPVDLAVSAGKIYVLDTGNLRVYDAFGNLRLISPEGARAGKLEASEKCVWLIGNGELMRLENS